MAYSAGDKRRRKRYRQRQRAKKRIANNTATFEDLSCVSKRGYKHKNSAQMAALNSELEYGKMFRVYKCGICGLWHLTSH